MNCSPRQNTGHPNQVGVDPFIHSAVSVFQRMAMRSWPSADTRRDDGVAGGGHRVDPPCWNLGGRGCGDGVGVSHGC